MQAEVNLGGGGLGGGGGGLGGGGEGGGGLQAKRRNSCKASIAENQTSQIDGMSCREAQTQEC